ncbi:hypothetical protein HDV05_004652 [Chytridiales sp. JEL 0842]|nr:hypothetical protein HDV05_004652 [Chytridiales sp. JEL 0842]
MASLDRSAKVTAEMMSVVQTLVEYVDKGGKGRKRGRGDVNTVEYETHQMSDIKRYPDGMVGLEAPSGPESVSISRLHAILQALRNSALWDRALKQPEQNDAYNLPQQTRILFSAMDALGQTNPSSIRPSSLHTALQDLTFDHGLAVRSASFASQLLTLGGPPSPGAFPSTVNQIIANPTVSDDDPLNFQLSPEDSLNMILSNLLRPQSYQFEERWETACPQCKMDSCSPYATMSFLDLKVANVTTSPSPVQGGIPPVPSQYDATSAMMGVVGSMTAPNATPMMGSTRLGGGALGNLGAIGGGGGLGDAVLLQSLVDQRMSGSLSPYKCIYERCPLRVSQQSVLALTRPQARELPPMLFIVLRRDTPVYQKFQPTLNQPYQQSHQSLQSSHQQAYPQQPQQQQLQYQSGQQQQQQYQHQQQNRTVKSARVVCPGWEFTISRNSEFFEPTRYRVVAGLGRESEHGGEYIMVRPTTHNGLGGMVGSSEPYAPPPRWIVCRNDKITEMDNLREEDERGLEVLLCENVAVRCKR